MLFRLSLVAGSVLLFLAPALGQQTVPADETAPDRPAKPAEPPALEGLWPSAKLMHSMLVRWADDASARYELDDAQRAKVREAVVQRWTGFLNENRATLQPLANEFFELRMSPEPPPKEAVQAWAKRAAPVLAQFREQINEGTEEFGRVLNPLQRAKFELENLQVGVGLRVAEQKLKNWQEGNFEPREFWIPPRAERRRQREERRRAAAGGEAVKPEAAPVETDQVVLELQAWDKYVEEFVRIYDLDEAQRTTARSCLTELKRRALDHRDRRREEIARLEERIQNNRGTDEELAEIKKQLLELYGPIDDLFKELKRRIETIPTTEQRARVAERSERKEEAPAE